MSKYYVIRTTVDGVRYKKSKTLDSWTSIKEEAWQYSKNGAKLIAERLNNSITPGNRFRVHYNTLEV